MNEEIKKQLHKDTAILEPQECFNKAIIGVDNQRLIYDYDLIIDSLMSYYGWEYIQALEWLEFNTIRSLPYMGRLAPIVKNTEDENE